jgi:Mn2+/Fe2+ NRAMP family transporter
MGEYANGTVLKLAAWGISAVIIVLNVKLLLGFI